MHVDPVLDMLCCEVSEDNGMVCRWRSPMSYPEKWGVSVTLQKSARVFR